jgi:hypothetical protein
MAISHLEQEMIKEIMTAFDQMAVEIVHKYGEKMGMPQLIEALAACHLGAVPRILAPTMGREIAVITLMKAAERELELMKAEAKATAH